ncbi:hypothetical protein JW921_06310 [Candidatus Fermentibacterales bacterium]|nr:hypothetical protein [Candidatus Fermentibacterales bacterium]
MTGYDRSRVRGLTPALVLFLFCLLVYVLPFRYAASGDTVGTELLPVSILRDGDFYLDEFFGEDDEIPYVLWELDGRLVNAVPALPGLLSVPVYFAADLMGVDILAHRLDLSLISMSLMAALSVSFLYLLLLRAGREGPTALIMSLVFAFGTAVWSLASRGAWQHGPSILLIVLALFLMFSRSPRMAGLSGLFMGLAFAARPANVFILAPLAAYALLHTKRSLPVLLASAAVPLGLLAVYSHLVWGSVWLLGQCQGPSQFTGNVIEGIPGLLLSPARGLLVFSPFFCFSLYWLARKMLARRARPLDWYLAAAFVITVLAYSMWQRWWGGWCFGYRYLSELTPLLMLPLAECYDELIRGSRGLKVLFFALTGISACIHFLGAVVYPSDFHYNPDDIDFNPSRLWGLRDTELVRLTRKLLQAIGRRI